MTALQCRFTENYEKIENGQFCSKQESLEAGTSKIFRVLDHIRETDRKAYQPKIVSIGPYHVDNARLRKMDDIKFLYVKRFIERSPRVTLKDYENIIDGMMESSKCWYSERVEMEDQKFSRMLLVDGCFILELLLDNFNMSQWKEDPILGNTLMLSLVEFDLLLLDNQMPLAILQSLYSVMVTSSDDDTNNHTLVDIFINSFRGLVKDLEPLSELPTDMSNIYHLLHLFHACFIAPPMKKLTSKTDATESTLMTPCATDLKDVGVKFMPIDNTLFSFKLSPRKDIIEISPARLNSNSNSFYRNLIIFEQYFFLLVRSRVMTYVMFMSCLVDTEADLALLRKERVVVYTLNYQEAARFFRKLCTDSIIDYHKSYLSQLKDRTVDLWTIYDTKWIRNMTYVRQTYFNNPLTMAYLVGSALFVVALTILQTTYSILSYYLEKKKH